MMRRRGMTLVEIMVSTGILVVVVMITMQVVLAGVRISRRGQQMSDANEGARLAGETVMGAIQSAGWGFPGGIYASHGGTVTLDNPVVVIDGATSGPDEIWVYRPHKNATLQSCDAPGAATTVQKTGTGALTVRCAVADAGTDTYAGVNMKTGAVLSNATFTAASPGFTLAYTESGIIADDPLNGFQKGDLIFPLLIEHYFIDKNKPTDNFLSLMVETGVVSNGTNGFTATSRRLVQLGVEDLQIAVGIDPSGSGDPSNITWQDGLPRTPYVPFVRSMRMSVVSTSDRAVVGIDDPQLRSNPEYMPRSLENRVASTTPDGFRRTVYTRRIELPNLNPADL